MYLAPFIVPCILRSLPVPAAEMHSHSMMLPPPCFMVGMVLDSSTKGDEEEEASLVALNGTSARELSTRTPFRGFVWRPLPDLT